MSSPRASDCARVKSHSLSERQIGDRFALMHAEWSLENSIGERILHYRTTYNLVRDEGRWKVAVIMRRNE